MLPACSSRGLRAAALLALTAAAVSLGGCTARTPTMFRPESPQGRHILTLTYIVFGILAAVLAVVWALLTVAIVRNRRRPEWQVRQTHGNLRLEIVWTAIPAIIVAVLLVLTLQTTGKLDPPGGSLRLQVSGHQWWWEVTYPESDVVTANEIHVPVDVPVRADLVSADVIHSFWVPQMGGKVDMIPGYVNHTRFVPVTEGEYVGECSEFCGHQHGNMRFLLIVEPAARFSAWIAAQQRPARRPSGAAATAGADAITRLPCAGCHTIRGTPLKGPDGPDLTHFASRRGIAALTLQNTPANLRRWIADPQAVKPESLMPTVPLTERQIVQLVAYLEGLR